MRNFTVPKTYHGKRVDRFIQSILHDLSFPLLSKTFRKRDVKVNGVRVKENHILTTGDRVEIYLSDDFLKSPKEVLQIPVIFEDQNILIVNKPQGIAVQDEKEASVEKIIKKLWSDDPQADFPALCHRLDRNTEGLLILAKNKIALDILADRFKEREICKFYRCVVCGCPEKPFAELKAYLVKESKRSEVKIYAHMVPGSLPIQTNYHVLETTGELSLLEVELVTGRTHQIRAHLAFIGHPILGDGKYGRNDMNRKYRKRQQVLISTRIQFCFKKDASILNDINRRVFSLPEKGLNELLK